MDYRELKFYHKAREIVTDVNLEIKSWPNSMQTLYISDQLFRSATSIGAYIAEGHGRHIGVEYIHYLRIAQGSANEVDHWLHTALDLKIGSKERIENLIMLNIETRKMLNATIKTIGKKYPGKTLREPDSPYSPNPYPLED
ncbi:MAG: four helix bundle protein [Chloroflexota bacterium]|nr:four helix bundle protein [Chloroflexota bacterium]